MSMWTSVSIEFSYRRPKIYVSHRHDANPVWYDQLALTSDYYSREHGWISGYQIVLF